LEAGESGGFLLYKKQSQRIIFSSLEDAPWSDGKSMALGSSPGLSSAETESQLISFLPVSQQLNGDSDSCCPEL